MKLLSQSLKQEGHWQTQSVVLWWCGVSVGLGVFLALVLGWCEFLVELS